MEYGSSTPNFDGTGLRIGVVQARFNGAIGEKMRDACIQELRNLGINSEDLLLITVPGALEIPLALQKLAHSGQFDALIALGAVIRGETYHFETVSNESARGIAHVALDYDTPIANGVLTTNTEAQAIARANEKGRDCARVAVEMANLTSALNDLNEEDDDDDDDTEDQNYA